MQHTITREGTRGLSPPPGLSPFGHRPLRAKGGGAADATQRSGWLETLLHSRFPPHQLVIRNLGYEGDEIDPAKRLHSADFGTPDQWLAGSAPIPRPDIIFACFGANEDLERAATARRRLPAGRAPPAPHRAR